MTKQNIILYKSSDDNIKVSLFARDGSVWLNQSQLAGKYLAEYTHKIGNLTITGYNSSLGNKSFVEKRERKNKEGHYIGYKNGLEINREIAAKDIWTIEDIKNRTSNLIEELMEIYKFPGE